MSPLSRFRSDARGNVGIIFTLAAVPFLLAAGMAVDFSRGFTVKSRVQMALDAGALAAAGAKTLTEPEREEIALATFQQNFKGKYGEDLPVEPVVNITEDSISMSATLEYPTAFMRIAGINTMDLGASVDVALPEDKKAEIVLVLDYSESMKETAGGRVKYIAMRDAATKLVEDLTEKGKNKNVRFGLVPFSHHVYVTLPGEYVIGQKAGTTWSGCTQDRKYPYNRTDDTPNVDDDKTRWGHPQAPEHIKDGCKAYVPNKLTVRPIGDDVEAITKQIQDMKPYKWTHIALGFEFGWHLLSPNAPFTDVAPYDDEDTMKVIVLLTDGEQTEPAFGRDGKRDKYEGNKNLARMCEDAKGKGIRVMTVAFDLDDADTVERLRECSTEPAKDFFTPDDGKDLAKSFDKIRGQLSASLRLAR